MARAAAALKAKYRYWTNNGKDVDSWRKLLDEIAVTLPIVRVPVSRLRTEGGELDADTLKRYSADVRADRCGEWRPIVIEGLRPPMAGPLQVVDGNHRATAAIKHGGRGLWLDAVIVREVVPSSLGVTTRLSLSF